MTSLGRTRPAFTIAALIATIHLGAAPLAAQHQGHQMPAPPAKQAAPQKFPAGRSTGSRESCEARAGAARLTLETLSARLDLARLTDNESEMRAAAAAADRAFRGLQQQLGACRGVRSAPAAGASPGGEMPGMDHSKMNMGAPSPPAAGVKPSGGQMAGMDHSTMNMGAAGPAAAPTTVRQISGPAEAALQAFTDALQIGNRDLAVEWLTPDVTVTEGNTVARSRDDYARGAMNRTMDLLKTATIVLLDRQVHPGPDSAHIVTRSHVTGRDRNTPVDVIRTETAQLRRLPEGWRVAQLEFSFRPAPR